MKEVDLGDFVVLLYKNPIDEPEACLGSVFCSCCRDPRRVKDLCILAHVWRIPKRKKPKQRLVTELFKCQSCRKTTYHSKAVKLVKKAQIIGAIL